MAMKTADKASISITRAISTKEGLRETEEHEVLFDSNMRRYNQLDFFLRVQSMCFEICHPFGWV